MIQAFAVSQRAAAGPQLVRVTEARRLARRSVYLGEGLTVNVVTGVGALEGEVVDLTPEGLGVVIFGGGPLPLVRDTVTVEHTGRATAGIRQTVVVRSVSEMRIGGRAVHRIGLATVTEETQGIRGIDRRKAGRHSCPAALPAHASATCPVFFREWLHFAVTELCAGGMTLTTSLRNKALFAGLELDLTLTLAIVGVHQVRGRVTSVRRDTLNNEFVVGIAWPKPSRELLHGVSEYLLLGDKALTPARLRDSGLKVGSVERAVTYDYASRPGDYAAVLKLRLRAHNAEGRLETTSEADMKSPYDAHSRHLSCRFGGRIVGYVRVIYVDGDPARSQYVTEGGHQVPEWLWKAGFVEAGAGATDPDFQRAGLFVPLMQHALRVAMQSGHRYMLGACSDELLDMYQQMGFELLETRLVEPKAGWVFRSHLICIDALKLVSDRPAGKTVEAMVSAVAFVGLPTVSNGTSSRKPIESAPQPTGGIAPRVTRIADAKARRLALCAKMMEDVVRGHRLARASAGNDSSR